MKALPIKRNDPWESVTLVTVIDNGSTLRAQVLPSFVYWVPLVRGWRLPGVSGEAGGS
jgi:hypothetical protein